MNNGADAETDRRPDGIPHRWHLPPLILHPFTSDGEVGMLGSLLDAVLDGAQDQEKRLFEARYRELRMLYFIGKDVLRWIRQCADFAARSEVLAAMGIVDQSFATLLVDDTPALAVAKLRNWGVVDYRAIFTRAIGLNLPFANVPEPAEVAPAFLMNLCHYGDSLFTAYQQAESFTRLAPGQFCFDLYSSREYTEKLEAEWRLA